MNMHPVTNTNNPVKMLQSYIITGNSKCSEEDFSRTYIQAAYNLLGWKWCKWSIKWKKKQTNTCSCEAPRLLYFLLCRTLFLSLIPEHFSRYAEQCRVIIYSCPWIVSPLSPVWSYLCIWCSAIYSRANRLQLFLHYFLWHPFIHLSSSLTPSF